MYGKPIYIMQTRPSSWKFYAAYISSTTFSVPSSGWYRVYCIGKCGNGENSPVGGMRYGYGGGGSGGMAISEFQMSLGETFPIQIVNGVARFRDLVANPGGNGSGQNGGAGGTASAGNIVSLSGFSGGNGGSASGGGDGVTGGNGGMGGGRGGRSQAPSSQPGGSGGGGGARLPGDSVCPYIAPNFSSLYRAGDGGGGSGYGDASHNADAYPAVSLTSSLKLYGGGGGRGGTGHFSTEGGAASNGSPAVIIIEIPA